MPMPGLAQAQDHHFDLQVVRCVVPMIVAAELSSWHAVLTTSKLGHVIDETPWGLCAAVLVTSLLLMRPRRQRDLRPALACASAIGVAHVICMSQFDVPVYGSRWLAETGSHQAPLTLWLSIPRADTVILLALMGLVLVVELLNSGLGAVVDMVSPEIHHLPRLGLLARTSHNTTSTRGIPDEEAPVSAQQFGFGFAHGLSSALRPGANQRRGW
jgi:hypothetical protein